VYTVIYTCNGHYIYRGAYNHNVDLKRWYSAKTAANNLYQHNIMKLYWHDKSI